jgi:hypothetical protein
MTTVGRDGSTNNKTGLTTGEKLMLAGLIACGVVGLFVLLVAIGTIR